MAPRLNPNRMHIGIIGGGRRCLATMELLASDSLKRFHSEIVGVADRNPEAVGFVEARRRGIFTSPEMGRVHESIRGLPGSDHRS